MKKLITSIIFLFSITAFSQFSKTHYIPPVSHADTQAPQGQFMYISCPSTTPVNFKIKQIGGAIISGTVSRDIPYVYSIGSGNNTQMLIDRSNVNQIMSNKGFIVEAEDLVYVAVRMTSTPLNYQAGSIVSKGLAALGRQFRVGAFENIFAPQTSTDHYTFATILATENNTTITFGSIKPGVILINNAAVGNTPNSIVLNQGQSFAMATEAQSVVANKNGLIGASISSDKDIVVNCGSFAGSNSDTTNLDLGMDQIVSAERTGTKYIFIKGQGIDITERPMVIADQDGTAVYLNGNATPVITLLAGQYKSFSGTDFSVNGNMFIETSKPVFAYQGIGGTNNPANQNMCFVPPLSCGTPKSINNIPLINEIGSLTNFLGTACVVAETGATLNFIINGTNYPLNGLPNNVVSTGPFPVPGNTQYVTYTFSGLTGNVSVFSTSQVYLSYYGTSGAATYGGYYSGFTFDPEISFIVPPSSISSGCLGSVKLEVNSLSSFDDFQWFQNGIIITGEINPSYIPTAPGYYFVRGKITACGTTVLPYDSVEVPVSKCPKDTDNDGVNDNIDIDLNNDGKTNCDESFGNLVIDTTNLTNPSTGNINIGTYSNSFTGTETASGNGFPSGTFTGGTNRFVTQVPAGKKNIVSYKMDFAQPISLSMEYVTTSNATDLLNSNANFKVNCSQNNTITVLNPTNQLLIDTNYDGIYESGVTQYSSFEIRFRVNTITTLAAGTGTFSFKTNLTDSFSFTQENLSDFSDNRATFSLIATCVPKDSDNDGVADQNDLDSDNDGILNFTENLGSYYFAYVNSNFTDGDKSGMYDFFEQNTIISDFDNDGIPNYLDLDSDNDGIYDLVESGSNAPDINLDGIVDGNSSTFGTNGLSNTLQNTSNSGLVNYAISNSDNSGQPNYASSDSDSDGCSDVIEAGFLDPNSDNYLGISPVVVNSNGVVTSGIGYTTPVNSNYITPAPIAINTQPTDVTACELEGATFTIATSTIDGQQWQVSTDNGMTFIDIINNANYSGASTNTLSLNNVPTSFNNNIYRSKLSRNGNSCGLNSNNAKLTINPKPILTTPITYKQCDDDTDGINIFNLTLKNKEFSTNFSNQTFTYFTTANGAETNDTAVKIINDTAFSNANGNTVWVRVVDNATLCYNIGELNLIVSVTQLPANFHRDFSECDDYLDAINDNHDGISLFDFSSVTTDIAAIIPVNLNYTLKYYRNNADASSEVNEIINISNYRNIGYPNIQQVIGRINSNSDNSCYGFAKVNLTVEKLPTIMPVNTLNIIHSCDDNQDGIFGFDTSLIETNLVGTQNVSVTYTDSSGNILSSPLPNPYSVNLSATINVKVTNNVSANLKKSCFDTYSFQFMVDKLPTATAVNPNDLIKCDDEVDPGKQDGKFDFNTSTFEATVLNGQTGMTINYTDAAGLDFYPMPNPFTTATQNIIATVTNPLNTNCKATTILSFKVNPRPKIELIGTPEIVCNNLPLLTKTLSAGITDSSPTTDYDYIWKKDGILLANLDPTLIINQAGIYSVIVTNKLTGCDSTRTIVVTPSEIAILQPPTITDLTENNVAVINPIGVGTYEYSLDDINGPYQSSNIFDNIPIGIHEIFVNDINKCGIVSQQLNIIGAPKFFTPNNDGINDFWNIKGIDVINNTNSTVTIYDRFGKLIQKLATSSQGWDGKFNEIDLPSDDYWFTLELQDGRFAKGHFSLKR